MKINWNSKYATIATYAMLVITGGILIYLVASQLNLIALEFKGFLTTLQPFLIGGSLAYILNFVLRLYERNLLKINKYKKLTQKGQSGISLLLTYLTAGFFTYLFIQFVLPQLIDSIMGLANNVPRYVTDVTIWGDEFIRKFNLQSEYVDLIINKFNEIIVDVINIASNLVPVIGNYILSVASSILNIFIGVIISIYILTDKEKFRAQGKKLIAGLF